MDVCVVTYRNDASAVIPHVRSQDRLYVHDNTVTNIGFAAGANRAAECGRDSLILFVNPDGELAPGALDALEAAFRDPEVVAAEADQGEEWNRAGASNTIDWLSGACLVVRRKPFQEVGGFDERLFMYCEDVDLSYKLAKWGRLVHVGDARFEHPSGPRSFLALHRNFRNWLVVQRRHRRARPAQMLRDAAGALRRGCAREFAARLTALGDYGVRARRWAS